MSSSKSAPQAPQPSDSAPETSPSTPPPEPAKPGAEEIAADDVGATALAERLGEGPRDRGGSKP